MIDLRPVSLLLYHSRISENQDPLAIKKIQDPFGKRSIRKEYIISLRFNKIHDLFKIAQVVFSDQNDKEIARQLYLRLVTLGEGVEDTRRRVLRSELEALTSDSGTQIVNDRGAGYTLAESSPTAGSP